jgi:putative transposase
LNRRIKSELFNQERFSTVQEGFSALKRWVEHYNHRRPHEGLGGFLVPAERFHGLAEKVLEEVTRGDKVSNPMGDVDRSLLNVVLGADRSISLYVLGRALLLRGRADLGEFDFGRGGNTDSGQADSTGEKSASECERERDL